MNNLTSIGGFFSLYNNSYLTSLEGLENLTTIGGNFSIHFNNSLANLSGLSNLVSINGNFIIDDNDDIVTFSGLENLTSINGFVQIKNNKDLINLSGLENIEANSISKLDIYDNLSLAYCQIQNICNYLAIPNADINIHDNATGCNNHEEVEDACGIGIPDITNETEFTIYPNPAQNKIHISCKAGEIIKEVNIYNQLGQKVISKKQLTNFIDVSELRKGIYIIELVSGNLRVREKLVVR